jgi:hypothetical protein
MGSLTSTHYDLRGESRRCQSALLYSNTIADILIGEVLEGAAEFLYFVVYYELQVSKSLACCVMCVLSGAGDGNS